MTATPRPWSLAGSLFIYGPGTECIATLEYGAGTNPLSDGLLIVRAVNAHDALVAELRDAANVLGRLAARLDFMPGPGDDGVAAVLDERITRYRAALRLAEAP